MSEPYHHLPVTYRTLRYLFCFQQNAHGLPIVMGWRLQTAHDAQFCPVCRGMHVGNEIYI